jgi:hypothetical protein
MSEEERDIENNPEKIDGQLPTIQDIFDDDAIDKIKKKLKSQLTK